MRCKTYKDGLCINSIVIKFTPDEIEYAEANFHGVPEAYYLLKFAKGTNVMFGWKPLEIEFCITDIDDLDIDYGYTAKDEFEFDKITKSITNWMKDFETKEHSVNEVFEFNGMPYKNLFRRVF